jgi:secreted trypsin-like serine protease
MNRLALAVCACVLAADAAGAIVGGAPPADEDLSRPVVSMVGPRNNICTATAIARDLLLTAAHCVHPGTEYRLHYNKANETADSVGVAVIERHPRFDNRVMLATGATADLALVKLERALPPDIGVAALGAAKSPIWPGDRFTVVGAGVSDDHSEGTARIATLVALGPPGDLQIRLVDPATGGMRPGLGACGGDSGSPVFQEGGDGVKQIAVVSWATGPNRTRGCGGITGATPLAPYRQWIEQTAKKLGIDIDY